MAHTRSYLCKDVFLDLFSVTPVSTGDTARSRKAAMAVDDTLDIRLVLERINVLCVVAQKLALLLDELDKHVARAGLVIARIELLCKRIKDLGRLAKVPDIKHLLRIVQAVFFEARIDARLGSKIRNAARN